MFFKATTVLANPTLAQQVVFDRHGIARNEARTGLRAPRGFEAMRVGTRQLMCGVSRLTKMPSDEFRNAEKL